MDADDVSHPDRLERQVDYLLRHPDVGLVGSWATTLAPDGRAGGVATTPVDDVAIKWQLNYRNPLHHPSVLVRRSLLDQVGGYEPSMRYAEDYDLFCRLARCTRMYSLPAPLISKRLHEVSTSIRHDTVQESVAVEISMSMVTPRLPTPPDDALIRALRRREFRDERQLREAVELLRQLERGMRHEAEFRGRRRRRALARAAAEAVMSLGRVRTTDTGTRHPEVKWRALPIAPGHVMAAAAGAGLRRVAGRQHG
jgi:hypothetical protein